LDTKDLAFQVANNIYQTEAKTGNLAELGDPLIRDIAGADNLGTQEIGDNKEIPFIRFGLTYLTTAVSVSLQIACKSNKLNKLSTSVKLNIRGGDNP